MEISIAALIVVLDAYGVVFTVVYLLKRYRRAESSSGNNIGRVVFAIFFWPISLAWHLASDLREFHWHLSRFSRRLDEPES